jgi:hypothetical protein
MNFESALAIKNELNSAFRVRGDRPRTFALGVMVPDAGPSEFGIAVRARTEGDLPARDRKRIEARASGQVDVRFTGTIAALAGQPAAAISMRFGVGASIAHRCCPPGTLGFFARRRSDQAVGLVSNNHVIAALNQGRNDDEILHPAPDDLGRPPRDVVGRLSGDYPRLNDGKVRVDCAFGRLVDGLEYDPGRLDGERRLSRESVPPYSDPFVSKIGRTTGLTHGRVSAVELDPFNVDYSIGSFRFDRQIEIQSVGKEPFSLTGDSGSLVFTSAGCNPVGLVFANSAAGGLGSLGLTYAHPIDAVLTALGITLLA